ncbi:MAG: 16S rRNA (guanine(966)-N(2))-methyltransferase RsmD [Chlamydiales bacterium]|nr:16S rRNA (guanine(966)-N(2))-methyltransferase RsmD [Chlamydiales bacterium]
MLHSPKGEQTRPTSEKVRQSFFNAYKHLLPNTIFLDLFAGSGAMGFEAISHGAAKVFLVENHKLALAAIHQNITSLDISKQVQVIPYDVLTTLHKLAKQQLVFDMVYIDPPYRFNEIKASVLHFLDTSSLIKKGAFIFLEENVHFCSHIHEASFQQIVYNRTKTLGETIIHEFSS